MGGGRLARVSRGGGRGGAEEGGGSPARHEASTLPRADPLEEAEVKLEADDEDPPAAQLHAVDLEPRTSLQLKSTLPPELGQPETHCSR